MIPVTVITGYLGSGKTTLLARLLADPDFRDTAVIINEFGEIGLDHDLIETSDEDLVTLKTGCLCCKMRGDLVETLEVLRTRRDAGEIPAFARVVVETSGLADPAPILQSLIIDSDASRHFASPRVVTVVDAVSGARTLAGEAEAIRQAALADQLIISKADLDAAAAAELHGTLSALNRTAGIRESRFGAIPAGDVLGGERRARNAMLDLIDDILCDQTMAAPRHASAVQTFAIVREEPIRASALTLFLEALADHCGDALLRLKGLVAIVEDAGRPAVVHGVQHVFHPLAWLEAWPSDDRRSRLVFIGRNLDEAWVRALLATIECEVDEITEHSSDKPRPMENAS